MWRPVFTFKQYLQEIFDKVHPFTQTKKVTYGDGGSVHQYIIHHPNGNKYKVHIEHDPTRGQSEIIFADEQDRVDMTGSSKGRAASVIGTVQAVVMDHIKNTPTAKSIFYAGDGDRGRKRIYTSISNRHGGTTMDMDREGSKHSIDVDKIVKDKPNGQ
jgi:hypothetical protein